MRVIVQRVQASRVEIDGAVSGEIGQGLMVLLGITAGDTKEHCDFLVDKLVHLRIFTDEQEKMNLSLKDIGGGQKRRFPFMNILLKRQNNRESKR